MSRVKQGRVTKKHGRIEYDGPSWRHLDIPERTRLIRACHQLGIPDLTIWDIAHALKARGTDGAISGNVILGHSNRNNIKFPGKAAAARRKTWRLKKAHDRSLRPKRRHPRQKHILKRRAA